MSHRPLSWKSLAVFLFLLWSTFVLSAFYVTQHPIALQVTGGIGATLWAVALTAAIVMDSAGLGSWGLEKLHLDTTPAERLLLGTGLGLGVFGLAGYGLAAIGLARPLLMIVLLLGILIWLGFTGRLQKSWADLKSFAQLPTDSPRWIKPAVLATLGLGFLFALLPPAEGFDGLLYHLTLPARLLADQHILPYNVVQFWFPSLVEGDFIWALGLGSERAAQLLHWSWSLLALGLAWEWTRLLWGKQAAWWAAALVVSMPSLPWLSSWAYTDMALVFTNLACLYAVWQWSRERNPRWLFIGGLFAGLAMGIKYTSFILPLTALGLILVWDRRNWLKNALTFSLTSIAVALPWYLRNWLVMGNPFYPFLFGGRDWDAFRAAWYAGQGTGIGWDWRELLLLPLTVMLGYRDQNFFDGLIGPLFLLLAPLGIWALWRKRAAPEGERRALLILACFGGLSLAVWVYGVIQTDHLWQARLLWPGLIPLSILLGLGMTYLPELDLPHLRVSFILNVIIGLVIFIVLLDNGLSLAARRPLVYALGMESESSYFKRIQPEYAAALDLVATTLPDAHLLLLFEPRSYGMQRSVQPDPINDNLMHDFYLYGNAQAILNAWQAQGYTHVLLYAPGAPSALQTQHGADDLQYQQLIGSLKLVKEAGGYQLYSIPPKP